MHDTTPSAGATAFIKLCVGIVAASLACYAILLLVAGWTTLRLANEAFWKFQADLALRGDLVELRRVIVRPSLSGVELRFCGAEFTGAYDASYRLRVPGCLRLRVPFFGKTVTLRGPTDGRYALDGDFSAGVADAGPSVATFRYETALWIGQRSENIAKNWRAGLRSIVFFVAGGNFSVENGDARQTLLSFDAARFGWMKNAAESKRGRYRAEIRNVRYEEGALAQGLRDAFPFSANVFFRFSDEGKPVMSNRLYVDALELHFEDFDVSAEGYVDAPVGLDIFPSASMRFFVENIDGMLASPLPLWFLRLPAESEDPKISSELRTFFGALGEMRDRRAPTSAEFFVERLSGGEMRIGGRSLREVSDMYERLRSQCFSPSADAR
ncbi:MAG: hypothetical protein ABW189_06840 [Rickettsiales bacterium]